MPYTGVTFVTAIGPQGPTGPGGLRGVYDLTVVDPSIVGDGTTGGMGAKITAALATLSDGSVGWLPPVPAASNGYRCNDQGVVIPTGKCVHLWGSNAGHSDNAGGSTLYFPTDLGAGTWGLSGGTYHTQVRGIDLRGNQNPSIAAHTSMTQRGCKIGDDQYWENVLVHHGFKCGFQIHGNHSALRDCRTGEGIYYGLMWDSPPTGGNNHFLDCNFTACSFASVGVESGSCDGNVFDSTSMGFSPYGVYGQASTSFSFNVFINNCNFEQCGNACIYVGAGGWIKGLYALGCGPTINASYRWATDGLRRGWIDVPLMEGCTFYLGDMNALPSYAPGTTCHVYAGTATGNKFVAYNLSLGGLPFADGIWGGDTGGYQNTYDDPVAGMTGQFFTVYSTAPGAGEAGQVGGDGNFITRAISGNTQPLLGVSTDGTAVGVTLVAIRGQRQMTADGVITIGDSVTPDGTGTAGRVKKKANATDRIIGFARTNSTAGNPVQVQVQPQLV